MATFR